MIEETSYKNIQLLLDNYRNYFLPQNLSEQSKVSDLIPHENEQILVAESQIPEIIMKMKNPYFDKNQSFFVNKKSFHTSRKDSINKVVIKEYTPNYYIQNMQKHIDNIDIGNNDLLGKIKEGNNNISERKHSFDTTDNKFNFKGTFQNIDIELELNYVMLNEEKKWLIFFPNGNQDMYGPYGTADIYMLVSTKNKNQDLVNNDFLIGDINNECFLYSDFSLNALSEEIMRIVRDNERHKYFYRHVIESHYNYPQTRCFIKEKYKNKFDIYRQN